MSTTRPTKAQIAWLQAIATGKVTYSLMKHAFFGYPGNPRRSTYVMCNAFRDGGWVEVVPSSADRFGHYAVALTDAGSKALAAAKPAEPTRHAHNEYREVLEDLVFQKCFDHLKPDFQQRVRDVLAAEPTQGEQSHD